MRICIVTSIGGHLDEVVQLLPVIQKYEYFFVVNAKGSLPKVIEEKTVRITHSERDWKLIINFWEAARILLARRPNVIISCGAGPAVPFAVVAKMIGIKVVFIETFCAVIKPSLTGRLLYPLADLFIYQWETLAAAYPKGVYGGQIF